MIHNFIKKIILFSIFLLIMSPFISAVIFPYEDNLIFSYNFNNEDFSGNIVIDESLKNNGTYFGADIVSALLGEGLDFESGDGSDRVETKNIDNFNSPSQITVMMLTSTESFIYEHPYYIGIDNSHNFHMQLYTNGNAYVQAYNLEDSNCYGYTQHWGNNHWNLVTYVYNGTNTISSNRLQLYYNTTKKSLTVVGTCPTSLDDFSSETFFIGTDNNSHPYDGIIDLFYVWDVALTKDDIETIYNSGDILEYQNIILDIDISYPEIDTIISSWNGSIYVEGNINMTCSINDTRFENIKINGSTTRFNYSNYDYDTYYLYINCTSDTEKIDNKTFFINYVAPPETPEEVTQEQESQYDLYLIITLFISISFSIMLLYIYKKSGYNVFKILSGLCAIAGAFIFASFGISTILFLLLLGYGTIVIFS